MPMSRSQLLSFATYVMLGLIGDGPVTHPSCSLSNTSSHPFGLKTRKGTFGELISVISSIYLILNE